MSTKLLKKCMAVAFVTAGTLFTANQAVGQVKIGDNPGAINPNAVLDIESATKGVLFPKVSLTSINDPAPLTAHTAGIQVYNLSSGTEVDPGFYYNDGTKWNRIGADAEKVFTFGSGAPSGACTVGTMYVDTLEASPTEGETFTCLASGWSSYVAPPSPPRTPFYFSQTTNDAGSNKNSPIWRMGGIGIGVKKPTTKIHAQGQLLMAPSGTSTVGMADGTHNIGGVILRSPVSDPTASTIIVQNNTGANIFLSKKTAAVGSLFVRFAVNGSAVGNIARTATGTAFNTTSDYRLKEKIRPTHYSIADLMKVEVVNYNFKADKAKTTTTGFIAQDLYKIFPDAVTVGGENVTEKPWTVDYGKVTPLLVKAIQDQQKEIASLKARLEEMNVLKAEVASIKSLLEKTESIKSTLSK
jgi:hypothetical protein